MEGRRGGERDGRLFNGAPSDLHWPLMVSVHRESNGGETAALTFHYTGKIMVAIEAPLITETVARVTARLGFHARAADGVALAGDAAAAVQGRAARRMLGRGWTAWAARPARRLGRHARASGRSRARRGSALGGSGACAWRENKGGERRENKGRGRRHRGRRRLGFFPGARAAMARVWGSFGPLSGPAG
jgi:hypothetical protein